MLNPVLATAPSLTGGSVVSAATSAAGPVAANSWVSIYGTNLSATTRAWNDGDFTNGGMPFSLDGVSVILTVFGAPRLAYVGYISPTQVNFLLPSDLSAGALPVQVRNPAGTSTPISVTVQANAGQLLTLDGKNVAATHANGTLAVKGGALPGVATTPAAPGETVVLYATGCGAVSPALTPGQVPAQASTLVTSPQVTIGGAAATVVSATVTPGSAGLYQIAVQVPGGAANGDLPLTVQFGTFTAAASVLTIQK